mmetsp:Transcript_23776/g.55466  ORF Transcript_23776/g.55466 Transcript_23776/m.55466 type:complete len:246 (+) Transcript_23776:316-1053(+)
MLFNAAPSPILSWQLREHSRPALVASMALRASPSTWWACDLISMMRASSLSSSSSLSRGTACFTVSSIAAPSLNGFCASPSWCSAMTCPLVCRSCLNAATAVLAAFSALPKSPSASCASEQASNETPAATRLAAFSNASRSFFSCARACLPLPSAMRALIATRTASPSRNSFPTALKISRAAWAGSSAPSSSHASLSSARVKSEAASSSFWPASRAWSSCVAASWNKSMGSMSCGSGMSSEPLPP